jgi:Arc/MetJ-type ribon-helix-helix transcriptional regulator
MTTTINISLPKSMYEDAKKSLKKRGYTSISELIRDSLRRTLYEDKNALTENGFPIWFEDKVLETEKTPINETKVIKTNQNSVQVRLNHQELNSVLEQLP